MRCKLEVRSKKNKINKQRSLILTNQNMIRFVSTTEIDASKYTMDLDNL